jgi:hypothetical protein
MGREDHLFYLLMEQLLIIVWQTRYQVGITGGKGKKILLKKYTG